MSTWIGVSGWHFITIEHLYFVQMVSQSVSLTSILTQNTSCADHGRRGVSLRFWGPRFAKQHPPHEAIRIYPAASARRHVIVSPLVQNNIYTPVPGVSSSVENRPCPESTRCCFQWVIQLSWCQTVFDGWVMAEWLARGFSKILGSPGSPLAST